MKRRRRARRKSDAHDGGEKTLATLLQPAETGDSLRDRTRTIFAEALALAVGQSGVYASLGDCAQAAIAVEEAMYDRWTDCGKDYKGKVRQLSFNLKDQKNPDLRRSVADGLIAPKVLLDLKPEELGSDERRSENAAIPRGGDGGGGSRAKEGGVHRRVQVRQVQAAAVHVLPAADAVRGRAHDHVRDVRQLRQQVEVLLTLRTLLVDENKLRLKNIAARRCTTWPPPSPGGCSACPRSPVGRPAPPRLSSRCRTPAPRPSWPPPFSPRRRSQAPLGSL